MTLWIIFRANFTPANNQIHRGCEKAMNKKLLSFVIMIAISIPALSSNEELTDIRLQLITSIHDNNCAYFTNVYYNKDESQIAIMHSNKCADKYQRELLDPNNFEQVFTFINFLMQGDNIKLTTKLYKDTLNNFTDIQHFQTLNSICLSLDNYKTFLDIYIGMNSLGIKQLSRKSGIAKFN